ncbi:MAG: hypothetical protein Q9N67_11710 [Ghiorsea sp.]|nr:hypothetical protein [Ghiorsea sp.]
MTVHIVVANRLIKIFGAIIKTLSYPFHALLPNFRFTIPEYSAAKCKSKQQQKIPKVIWQTNFTNQASFPVYINYLFNRLMSLSYDYRYVSTEVRLEYLEANASPEIVTCLQTTDQWRGTSGFMAHVCAVERRRGVYGY